CYSSSTVSRNPLLSVSVYLTTSSTVGASGFGEGVLTPPWYSAFLSTVHAPHSAPARCSLRSNTPTYSLPPPELSSSNSPRSPRESDLGWAARPAFSPSATIACCA